MSSVADAQTAVLEAERKADDLRGVLTVLSMAIGFETAGLDAEERSGIEVGLAMAGRLAADLCERFAEARSALDRLKG